VPFIPRDRPNVLVTSASRKVLLVRAFKEALAARGSGRVLAADIDPTAAALYAADGRRLLPRSDDPAFADTVRALCESERVGLVVPTRDEELPVLAGVRDELAAEGTLVLVSAPGAVETCQDKARFVAAVAAAGLDAPATYADLEAVEFPAFAKPRRGKAGAGAARVADAAALRALVSGREQAYLVQELIEAPEYTIDVFIDLAGTPISCVPRERVRVIDGESVVSRTIRDPGLCEATLRLCSAIGLIGHLTVQAFRSPERIAFIEVNPRYGGAANLGFRAGAFTPAFAVALARGEAVAPQLEAYVPDLVMLRHSDDIFVTADALDPGRWAT
jgi:carbamoyl-phosphate synthase large subunit